MGLIEVFFNHTITIKPFIRMGGGEPVYGPNEIRRCRFENGRNLKTVYKNPSGQIDETVAGAKVFCCGNPIPERSVVTHKGSNYIVISCAEIEGFGPSHLEVMLE